MRICCGEVFLFKKKPRCGRSPDRATLTATTRLFSLELLHLAPRPQPHLLLLNFAQLPRPKARTEWIRMNW
jgi:hypothetical protein